MAVQIHQSVGRRGRNDPEDVGEIQLALLEHVHEPQGGPQPGFVVNRHCDGTDNDPTVVAIKKFQWRQARMPNGGARAQPDGRFDPGGPSLRRLNAYNHGQGPTPPTPDGPRGGEYLPLLFEEMWRRIESNRAYTVTYRSSSGGPPELINAGRLAPTELWMAIFWEESNYRNKRGKLSFRGVFPLGFGQVMESNLGLLKPVYGTSFTAMSILHSFDESIRVAMLALAEHWRTTHDLGRALRGYAHEQDGIVSKWRECHTALEGLGLRLEHGAMHFTDSVSVRLREILWAARDGKRGCTSDLAFA